MKIISIIITPAISFLKGNLFTVGRVSRVDASERNVKCSVKEWGAWWLQWEQFFIAEVDAMTHKIEMKMAAQDGLPCESTEK